LIAALVFASSFFVLCLAYFLSNALRKSVSFDSRGAKLIFQDIRLNLTKFSLCALVAVLGSFFVNKELALRLLWLGVFFFASWLAFKLKERLVGK
jgi:hypothetical protein